MGMGDVYVMQSRALENLKNSVRAENGEQFDECIRKLRKAGRSAEVAYIETTSPEHYFSSSSIAILDKDKNIMFWFGLSAEGIWVNQYKHPEKVSYLHYHKTYSVKSTDLVTALESAKNQIYDFGFLLGDNCKVFALNFMRACKLDREANALQNSGRCRPGTKKTLSQLTKGVVLGKALISLNSVSFDNFSEILSKYITYRSGKKNRLSLFGGYTRMKKIAVAEKILGIHNETVELSQHDYQVMMQGRLGSFIKHCRDSHLLTIEKISKDGQVQYRVVWSGGIANILKAFQN